MLDSGIDVSIIIVNWNTADLLHSCLDSLRAGVGKLRAETIVVDNGSLDGSPEMVSRDFPAVHLLRNERNLGFATANNIGLRQGHGRYLLLLNSDTIVLPGAIEAMVQYSDEHARVGALGPLLLNADHSLQSTMRDFPTLGHDAVGVLELERWPLIGPSVRAHAKRTMAYWDEHKHTCQVAWVTGACLLLRREALDDVGLLDEGYFFYAEEMDLCYRLHCRGWLVTFFPGASIIHLGGQSSARVPAARLLWHYAGLQRFYRLHRTKMEQRTLRLFIAVTALVHVVWLLLRHRQAATFRSMVSAYASVLARAVADS